MSTLADDKDILLEIETLEQETYELKRALETEDFNENLLDEEIELDRETIDLLEQEMLEVQDKLQRQLWAEENKVFTETSLMDNTSSSFLHDSSVASIFNSPNASLYLNESVAEPIEIELLDEEIHKKELELREKLNDIREAEIELEENKNKNLIEENKWKNMKHDLQVLKENITEQEEDLVLVNAEMNLLPRLKSSVDSENSIYSELVRNVDLIKTDLTQKKEKLKEYTQVLSEIETECKHIESEMLVLNVHDSEDEAKRLKSQANLLEAYKQYLKALNSHIQYLLSCDSDIPQLVPNNASDAGFIFKISQYHEIVDAKINKFNRELNFYKIEEAGVKDKESQLSNSVQLLRTQVDKVHEDIQKVQCQIQEKKTKQVEELKVNIVTQVPVKEGKAKTVRFQTNTPEKEQKIATENEDDKENTAEESKVDESKAKEKMSQQNNYRVVIHRRKQNVKPFNVINSS